MDMPTGNINKLSGGADAYLALPAGSAKSGAVIVIHEIFGLVEHIKNVAKRFADLGFVGLAPDLYEGKVASSQEEGRKIRGEVMTEPKYLGIIDDSIAFLNNHPGVDQGKIGIVGFCMGGGFSLLAACHRPAIKACVIFYGRIENPDLVRNVEAPVLGIFGEADEFITPWAQNELAPTMKKYGKNFEMHVYSQAPHAFFNDTRDRFRADAAKDAWKRTITFFSTYLK